MLSIHDILLLGSCTSLELCKLVDRISDMLQTIQFLNVSPMKDDYIHMQKTVLCLVVVFNQKLAGEASKIKLIDYSHGYKTSMIENSKEYGLALFEKQILTHHRLEIPGKWGRHVPHYTYNRHAQRIRILIELRNKFGLDKNP